jgi:thiamine pyrophosphate-dependent acetolactate synthase large subunit-like protein
LIAGADLVVSFGAGLNRWTTRNGSLLRNARVVQVDLDLEAIGAPYPVDLGIVADSAGLAEAVVEELKGRGDARTGYRSDTVAERIASGCRWQDLPYEDAGTTDRIDPRTLTIALDGLLPHERVVVPDGGNFNGYPAMFLSVPDERGYCLPLAFQSIGMALAASIGAAVAKPDRVAVAGLGDGGFMMSLAELDTAVRVGGGLLIVVLDDEAYAAEVHRLHSLGLSGGTATFPSASSAAVMEAVGGLGVRVPDLAALEAVVSAWTGHQPLLLEIPLSRAVVSRRLDPQAGVT